MNVMIEISAVGCKKDMQILGIAAVRVGTEDLNIIEEFSTFVQPEDSALVDWRKSEYLQSIQGSVMNARPLDQVLTEFVHWLTNDDRFYCWDNITRGLFEKICRRFGKRNWVINTIRDRALENLNDGHKKKGNPIKLCKVRGYDVSWSCNDAGKVVKAVIRLAQKTGKSLEELAGITKTAPTIEKPALPLVYSKTSHRKTVHRLDCGRLQRISEDKKAYFPDMNTAQKAGYHPCSCCSPIRKMYKKEERKIVNYCRPHGITITYHDDTVHVHSRYDLWRIVFDDTKQKPLLLHKNNKIWRNEGVKSLIPGFHEQKCEAITLKGILRNIVIHDQFREQQDKKEVKNRLSPKDAKKMKNDKRKRGIRRTLLLIEELKASGKL